MTKFEPSDLRAQWKELFGTDCPTVQQAWFLTKFAKHVRTVCKNNKAFNNFMNAAFGHGLSFQEAPKVNQYGEEYDGLEIKERVR